ncbi:MAG: D-alanine--D-alanine ligase family protein [bacterium]
MNITILQDQIPEWASEDEQDVSAQSEAIFRALSNLGYEPGVYFFSFDLEAMARAFQEANPLVVFNLVEAVSGKGQLIYTAPAMMDSLKQPYTGSSAEALFLTSNKLLAKRMLRASGISTPPWISGESSLEHDLLSDQPYIIKSVWEHASIGLNENSVLRVKDGRQLHEEMKRRQAQLGGACFAEAYVEGREFNLTLLAGETGPEILPPAEIRFLDYPDGKARIVDFSAKWKEESFEFLHTRREYHFPEGDTPLLQEMGKIARECWKVFELRGYARVDFRIDHTGKPWVLEINANPCLAPDSGFVAAARQAGLDFDQVIERVIKDSVPSGLSGHQGSSHPLPHSKAAY